MKVSLRILKPMLFATCLSTSLGMSTVATSAAEDLITVRGMSIASDFEDIETAMGPCADNRDQDDLYYCGASEFNSFRLDQSGRIKEIYVACEIFNGCDYDVENLAHILKDRMDTIQRLEMKASGFMGDYATLTGQAGDTLEIWAMDEGPLLIFRVGMARSQLTLE
ncbi:hypothetical protein [Roseovarius sp. Pro17]|uniref:hypothetical protein n=1 Tax=Roseovarius sp. Pro17 TaxID=3108175 RepID=UPI002D77735F|nr:hypothetical protein [Roseovarius sp. Pro17]